MGMLTCPIYDRASLAIGATIHGPAVIEQADTTTFLEAQMTAVVDLDHNLILSEV